MRTQIALLTLILLLPLVEGFTQPASAKLQNTRVAKGNTLVSDSLPKLKLKFGKDFKYAGGQTFILYDVLERNSIFMLMPTATGAFQGSTGFSSKDIFPRIAINTTTLRARNR